MTWFRKTAVLLGAIAGMTLIAACGSSGSGSKESTGGKESSSGGSASASKLAKGAPIKIGAVIDESNLMAPTDDPALYGAELEAKKINAAGGVNGHKIEFTVQNDQLKPELTRSDALNAVSKGSNILWVTCDVNFATPAIEVGLAAKLLTVSPCIGTDQMGPKRFGTAGELAFSYGNVAQDEGAADAQVAIKHGWKTAAVATDKQIAYNQEVCATFEKKYKELGGKIVTSETWTQGDGTVGNVANSIGNAKASVIFVCTTAAPDISTLLSDVRSLGNKTPFLAPWSLDGTYWMPKSPSISTNFWTTSYTSIYGDDPSAEVRQMIKELTAEGHAPQTGGFVTGAAAVQGIVAAFKEDGESLEGAALAKAMVKFKNLETISGKISFSPGEHTVTGRAYAVLEVTNRQGKFKEMITASGGE